MNSGSIKAGTIKVKIKDSDLINRGTLSANALTNGTQTGGDSYIKVSNLILELGKTISADRLMTIDADAILEVVYTPEGTAVAASQTDVMNSGEVISAPTVNVTMRKIGSSSTPVYIKAGDLYIKSIEGNIDISESLGIGTSILMRGPPEVRADSRPASQSRACCLSSHSTELILVSRPCTVAVRVSNVAFSATVNSRFSRSAVLTI